MWGQKEVRNIPGISLYFKPEQVKSNHVLHGEFSAP